MSAKYKIRDQHGLNYLTCTVCGWIDLFNRAEYRDILLENLKFCRDNKGLQIWAYVIMSNHIHLIVSTKKPYKLEAVMRNPEDWVYSSASNYATGEGVFETDLLWTGFSEDGWFYGDTGLVGI